MPFDEARELTFVGIIIIILQHGHVIRDMFAKDMISMNLSIEFASLVVITREPLCTVRYFKTTISCSFECTKDTCTSGGTHQTDIQETMESTRLIIFRFNHVLITIHLCLSLVYFVQL